MSFFCDLRVLAKKLASRLATQRKSLRKFNLRPLANTCRSVWPRLNIHTFPLFFRLVYKPARVTWVGGLPYAHARVTLAGGLNFPL